MAHELRERFEERCRWLCRWLCPESIYQAIYDPETTVTCPARRRRRRQRRRRQGLQRRGRLTAMRMIAARPVEVEDRLQAGHWEGDLIMGPGNRSAIGRMLISADTIVCRRPTASANTSRRTGIRRRHGPPQAPRRAAPFDLAPLQQVLAELDTSTLAGLRDRVLLLLGVVALDVEHLQFSTRRLVVRIASSMTSQERAGATVAVPFARAGNDYCAV